MVMTQCQLTNHHRPGPAADLAGTPPMPLTTVELDELANKLDDITYNLLPEELEEAISSLNEQELVALKEECLALTARQTDILRMVAEALQKGPNHFKRNGYDSVPTKDKPND